MTRVKLFDYGLVDCSSIPGRYRLWS